ncbi:hypothetical protein [Neisseria meningitidis serogroup B]|uniref:Uncharacterized protein n=1 Tax=Neisseria meningitidis serogroup B TaxID=491 RepID=A0A0H5QRP1_NEIMI|nr:hypothetical protein [Neisseria meningitidis serogroup B]
MLINRSIACCGVIIFCPPFNIRTKMPSEGLQTASRQIFCGLKF